LLKSGGRGNWNEETAGANQKHDNQTRGGISHRYGRGTAYSGIKGTQGDRTKTDRVYVREKKRGDATKGTEKAAGGLCRKKKSASPGGLGRRLCGARESRKRNVE